MHNLPAAIALLENRGSESASLYVMCLSVTRDVSGDRVLQCRPGRIARHVNLDVVETVRSVTECSALGNPPDGTALGAASATETMVRASRRSELLLHKCDMGDYISLKAILNNHHFPLYLRGQTSKNAGNLEFLPLS